MKEPARLFLLPFGLFLFVLFAGCSKDTAVKPPVDIKGTFSFIANGINYNWDFETKAADYNIEKPHVWKNFYNSEFLLVGNLENRTGIYDPILIIKMLTDTLKEATYTLSDTTAIAPGLGPHLSILEDNFTYESIQVGDYGTVTVSKIHDGYVDGTFEALMTRIDSTLSKLTITSGKFKNLKIIYQ